MTDALMTTYNRLPVAFARGDGAWLWDEDGNRYLDGLCGIAVTGLGHAHPDISAALADQAATLLHTSNFYRIPLQEQLGERLCALSGMDRAFLCNSGAEANEAALKLARLHGHSREIDLPAIVVMEQSFHGRTLATLSASGSRKVQAGFEPLVQGFIRVPYNDLEAVRAVARNSPTVAAVLVEPVLGEGGIRVPDPGYLAGLREICDQNDWLLMLDEIQTGIARTGKLFAFQHEEMVPDVITLAKALGNGMPIGACLARGTAAALFQPGNHGTTFGGNPLACRVGMSVLDVVERDGLAARAAELGDRLAQEITTAELPGVIEVRHHGLMIGIELDRPATALPALALEHGLLLNVTAERVIRLLPPMILSDDEAGELVVRLASAVRAFAAA
ncbi:MAG: aspartate aminotransferase family protein [Gammaproteobacteria bacterium]|nr:MAG: aspartate aminotransferase family protein [Gammaproteobacteria bacterium]